MSDISLSHVTLKLGARTVLKDINWTVEPGEHWAVLGINGSGKTTLTSLVGGYLKSSEGQVEVLGQVLSDDTVEDLRAQIGFVSGSYFDKCYRYETGLEIALTGCTGGVGMDDEPSDAQILRAKHLIKELGIGKRGMYPYHLLSKGQQQKVLLARLFMSKARLLVLDEPCTGLDILSREYLLNTLAEIAKESPRTILFVTHHPDEITELFDHLLLLRDGVVYAQGTIADVLTTQTMSDFFEQPTEVSWEDGKAHFRVLGDNKMDKRFWQEAQSA